MSRPGERTINAHGPAKDSARAPAGEGLQIKSPRTFQVKELLSRPANFTCLAWTCDGDSLVAGATLALKASSKSQKLRCAVVRTAANVGSAL